MWAWDYQFFEWWRICQSHYCRVQSNTTTGGQIKVARSNQGVKVHAWLLMWRWMGFARIHSFRVNVVLFSSVYETLAVDEACTNMFHVSKYYFSDCLKFWQSVRLPQIRSLWVNVLFSSVYEIMAVYGTCTNAFLVSKCRSVFICV